MSSDQIYGIDEDEWYPVYTIVKLNPSDPLKGWNQIILTDEEYQDYKRVMSEFWEWQGRLRDSE